MDYINFSCWRVHQYTARNYFYRRFKKSQKQEPSVINDISIDSKYIAQKPVSQTALHLKQRLTENSKKFGSFDHGMDNLDFCNQSVLSSDSDTVNVIVTTLNWLAKHVFIAEDETSKQWQKKEDKFNDLMKKISTNLSLSQNDTQFVFEDNMAMDAIMYLGYGVKG